MGLLDRWTKKEATKQLSAKPESKKPAKEMSGAEVAEKKPAVAAAPVVAEAHSFRFVLRPVVTEKSARSESAGKYTFVVARSASKTQVKQAINQLYGVKPISVNMVNVEGKRVRFGRSFGRRSDLKKAIVTLPKGKTISIHEGV